METPAVTITPAAEDGMDPDAASENRDDENHEKDNDAEITAIPEITETPDTEENKDNIFDRKDDTEDKRPQNAATDLTETEKEEIASQNHTCDGITVSGIDLPWYVQFRVSGGEDYQLPMKKMQQSLNPMSLNSGIHRIIQSIKFRMESISV